MATYLNFVSIGQYELKQGIDHGLPYVYAVSEQLSVEDRKKAFAALMTSGERIRTLEAMFGPYPFSEIGGIVPVHQLPFGGLETQTRPVYDARSILNAASSQACSTTSWPICGSATTSPCGSGTTSSSARATRPGPNGEPQSGAVDVRPMTL